MDFLIITENYPSCEDKYSYSFVHSRCTEYKKSNLNFKVLSFRAEKSYSYEGIDVLNEKDYINNFGDNELDLVISHAPNIKNHVRFLIEYRKKIKNMLFFIHGHEVLKINEYYPKPYDFINKKSIFKKSIQDGYDYFKLRFLKKFFLKNLKLNKVKFVFVSEWMKKEFLNNVKLDVNLINKNSYIIFNNANVIFQQQSYKKEEELKADVITIRPLDNSKYGVDLVCKIAENNPKTKFHIYGVGEYFLYNHKPQNVEVFQKFFTHNELVEELNHYRLALMPTRLDAQGVMVCEMVTYGIPVLTSDLPICTEMTKGFSNVFYFNNENADKLNITDVINNINLNKTVYKDKFSIKNTVEQEIQLILNLIRS